ncbi:NUDIX hydrolase [Lachnobacterium bovis]|uniref:8-oxo-dGTP diphosphatase n=1 Tax=Lachnobacterium bovis TaxID=140626 RepID=A0A1H9TCA0_9FIRM|nr:NUDIX hydrolase [Lachnobacterium bovis]SER94243.1 8-oxo-dGTP diphosphatase [Lachnobacterium bovis]
MNTQQTEKEFLKTYNPNKYERPSVTADILVFTTFKDELYLLMIQRKSHPYKDRWAIPGGFVSIDETAKEAAIRELYEETSVKDVCLEQLYTFSKVDRDPRMRVISIAYIVMVPFEKLKFKSGDDAKNAKLFLVNAMPDAEFELISKNEDESTSILQEKDLAFDHYEIIKMAIKRLRGKIKYSNIAFSFLKDLDDFTLTELRNIYDAINSQKADVGNFRRFIKREYEQNGFIVQTDLKRIERGRPATTYKWAKERSLIFDE